MNAVLKHFAGARENRLLPDVQAIAAVCVRAARRRRRRRRLRRRRRRDECVWSAAECREPERLSTYTRTVQCHMCARLCKRMEASRRCVSSVMTMVMIVWCVCVCVVLLYTYIVTLSFIAGRQAGGDGRRRRQRRRKVGVSRLMRCMCVCVCSTSIMQWAAAFEASNERFTLCALLMAVPASAAACTRTHIHTYIH